MKGKRTAAGLMQRCIPSTAYALNTAAPCVTGSPRNDLCSGKMTYALTLLTVVFTAHFVFSSSSAPDVNPNILKAANFAIASYNRKSNYPYAYKVVDVLSQSVALYPPTGVKYSMELQVTETNCRNDGNVNLQDCSLRSNAQTMTCSFVVLAVPGENTMPEHLLSDHCT